MTKYKIVGLIRKTGKVAYEKECPSLRSLHASLEWAFRKGADTILITASEETGGD